MTLPLDTYLNCQNLAKSNSNINQLVNAANSLFAITIKLKETSPPPNLDQFKKVLIEEIKNFMDQANTHKYQNNIVNDACCVLCDFIDNAINTTSWGQVNNWQQNNLLNSFAEDVKDKNFFALLKQASENPALNLDLLELMYLCLSLGYEGKYRDQKKGQSALASIKEDLYELITKHRKTCDPSLLVNSVPEDDQIILHKKIKKFPLPLLFAIFFVISLGVIIFFTLNSKLNKSTTPISKIAQNISLNSDNINGS